MADPSRDVILEPVHFLVEIGNPRHARLSGMLSIRSYGVTPRRPNNLANLFRGIRCPLLAPPMSAFRGTADIVFFAAQLLPKINMELWFRSLETRRGKDHTYSPIRLSCKSKEAITQPIQHTEISRQSSNLFSAREVAQTIGADLETINEWLEVGAIDRAVFGGGRFSKYELQRAALTLELVKLGLAPSCARTVVWEMEYDLQQIWGEAISKQYKAYAIVIPNKQKKWLVFWCWKTSTQEIEPSTRGDIILPVSDILARVAKSG